MLGVGQWQIFITERGGGQQLYEVPFSRLSFPKVLNATAQASVTFPMRGPESRMACQVIAETEPFRHELSIWRNEEEVFVGPVWDLDSNEDPASPTLLAKDLSGWTMRRWVGNDLFYSDDVATIFEDVFNQGMAVDLSPNVTCSTKATGVTAERNYRGKDYQYVANIWSELSKTAVDWTTIGRRVIAGGIELNLPGGMLMITDDGVAKAGINKPGDDFATDVVVIGAVPRGAVDPVIGRTTRGADVYGVVQRSFPELLIEDEVSAESNSASRVDQMQPVPKRLRVVFSPNADPSLNELIPSSRADVRLSNVNGCLEMEDVMRLQSVQVDVQVNDGGIVESISGDFIPLGLSSEGA